MSSSARRKSSAKRLGGNAEDEEAILYHIRYDYSATHLDNETLEQEFETQADDISRDKYRTMAETNELLKQAKQNADDMLKLKNKVKTRQPHESSERVRSSVESKRSANKKNNDTTTKYANDDTDGKNIDDVEPKPSTGHLTMFLLSKRTLTQPSFRGKRDETPDRKKTTKDSDKSKLQKRPMTLFMTSRNGQLDRRNSSPGDDDVVGRQLYGIHVRKDFSRSRRELEEISRLEQDKHVCVNKYEERRKHLLAKSKDTESLQKRISFFLKDVDEFKCRDNTKTSLIRSKTTIIPQQNASVY